MEDWKMKQLYTITADEIDAISDPPPPKIRVFAACHRQHTPYATTLIGVARSAQLKIDSFLRTFPPGRFNIRVDAGPYWPALSGYELED